VGRAAKRAVGGRHVRGGWAQGWGQRTAVVAQGHLRADGGRAARRREAGSAGARHVIPALRPQPANKAREVALHAARTGRPECGGRGEPVQQGRRHHLEHGAVDEGVALRPPHGGSDEHRRGREREDPHGATATTRRQPHHGLVQPLRLLHGAALLVLSTPVSDFTYPFLGY
jgi:hypothetical protein